MTPRTIRSATVGDASAIASVHVTSSDDAYAPLAGSWPLADASERTAAWLERLRKGSRVLVAEIGGAVVGFASGGPARRSEPNAQVELYVIHVHPAHRGLGVGADVWRAACEVLRGPGLASMYVDTLGELRCCSFYERHGGQVTERRPIEFHGATRTHVTYLWPSGAPSGPEDARSRGVSDET